MIVVSMVTQWEKRGRNGQGFVSTVGKACGEGLMKVGFSITSAVSTMTLTRVTHCDYLCFAVAVHLQGSSRNGLEKHHVAGDAKDQLS